MLAPESAAGLKADWADVGWKSNGACAARSATCSGKKVDCCSSDEAPALESGATGSEAVASRSQVGWRVGFRVRPFGSWSIVGQTQLRPAARQRSQLWREGEPIRSSPHLCFPEVRKTVRDGRQIVESGRKARAVGPKG